MSSYQKNPDGHWTDQLVIGKYRENLGIFFRFGNTLSPAVDDITLHL